MVADKSKIALVDALTDAWALVAQLEEDEAEEQELAAARANLAILQAAVVRESRQGGFERVGRL